MEHLATEEDARAAFLGPEGSGVERDDVEAMLRGQIEEVDVVLPSDGSSVRALLRGRAYSEVSVSAFAFQRYAVGREAAGLAAVEFSQAADVPF